MHPPLLFEALRVTCLHVVLGHVNSSSLTFFIILVSVQRSEESFRYRGLALALRAVQVWGNLSHVEGSRKSGQGKSGGQAGH